MWWLRITLAKLRPLNGAAVIRLAIAAAIFALFIVGDYALFWELFKATSDAETMTPLLAIGLLRNLLAMVFMVATVVLFSSAMTAAIASFFSDLDLEIYHAAPVPKLRIIVARWVKTFFQSAVIVYVFLIPLFVAFARHYGAVAYPAVLLNLALLLAIPVSLASLTIVLLVRWFPVRRVHQIVATLAILVLTVAVVAFRMSRPERLFNVVGTDDVVRVLRAIDLPSMEAWPGTSLADGMADQEIPLWMPKIALSAAAPFLLFVAIASRIYFAAFVRARESMAPPAIGSALFTRLVDRLLAPFDAPTRALAGKEIRTLTRDVAQWSQVFLMAALMFLYLYNIRMLPLGGDARATLVAYANLGMAGFVVAAICLRFAYPSVSSEGKAFWMLQSAPLSYRRFLIIKVLVYGVPLTILSLVLTAFADVLLDASGAVWAFTLFGASLLAVTLVSLGVGLGAWKPNFAAENPLQVGLSLGGFGYMGVALAYVGAMMLLMARPVMRFVFARMFAIGGGGVSIALPLVIGVTASILLCVFPLLIAEKRLARLGEVA